MSSIYVYDDSCDSLEQLASFQPEAITTQSDCDHWQRGGDESWDCDDKDFLLR